MAKPSLYYCPIKFVATSIYTWSGEVLSGAGLCEEERCMWWKNNSCMVVKDRGGE